MARKKSQKSKKRTGKKKGKKKEQRDVFITSTGIELPLKRISPILVDKAQASEPMPERPTYTAETAGGGTELHPHDHTTLETDEDKAAWQEYLMKTAFAQRLINERVTMVMFYRGIDYDAIDLPEDDTWITEQREVFGIDVPEDPLKLKRHWVETEALSTPEEIKELVVRLMAMTGAPEEVVAVAERSFRRPVEGDAPAESTDSEGGVELQSELPPDEDGEGVGQDG